MSQYKKAKTSTAMIFSMVYVSNKSYGSKGCIVEHVLSIILLNVFPQVGRRFKLKKRTFQLHGFGEQQAAICLLFWPVSLVSSSDDHSWQELMDSVLCKPVGRTLTLRTATKLLHTSTPPTNSAWMPSFSRTCLKSDRRGSLMNTD